MAASGREKLGHKRQGRVSGCSGFVDGGAATALGSLLVLLLSSVKLSKPACDSFRLGD